MATATQAPAAPPPSEDAPFLLTFDDFALLVESGRIGDERRVYLRDGTLYEKMAKTLWHGAVGAALNLALTPRLPAGWSLWPESTIKLDGLNGRLPDFAVIRTGQPLGHYNENRYPTADEVGLAISIAHTSLAKDPGENLQRYARAGIPIYWVVDTQGCRLLIHEGPIVEPGRLPRYERCAEVRAGAGIELALPGAEVVRIPAAEFVPARRPGDPGRGDG